MVSGMFIQPLVSVIILHTQRAQYLPTLLSDLRKQSYQYVEIIVVDADKTNSNQIDVLAGQYPEVRFIPYFGEPTYMEMLRSGAKMAKGTFSFVLSIEAQLPRACIELMLQHFSTQQNNIKVLGLHIFAAGSYWRRSPSKVFPWLIRSQKVGPTEAASSAFSSAMADSSAFLVLTSSLSEITGNPAFTSEWGFYFWQQKLCCDTGQKSIAPGISVKTVANMNMGKHSFAENKSEALAIINNYKRSNPLRYYNYLAYYGYAFCISICKVFRRSRRECASQESCPKQFVTLL